MTFQNVFIAFILIIVLYFITQLIKLIFSSKNEESNNIVYKGKDPHNKDFPNYKDKRQKVVVLVRIEGEVCPRNEYEVVEAHQPKQKVSL